MSAKGSSSSSPLLPGGHAVESLTGSRSTRPRVSFTLPVPEDDELPQSLGHVDGQSRRKSFRMVPRGSHEEMMCKISSTGTSYSIQGVFDGEWSPSLSGPPTPSGGSCGLLTLHQEDESATSSTNTQQSAATNSRKSSRRGSRAGPRKSKVEDLQHSMQELPMDNQRRLVRHLTRQEQEINYLRSVVQAYEHMYVGSDLGDT